MNRQPNTTSSALQTFGPGTTTCRVTNYVKFTPTENAMTHGTIELMKLMAQTVEFESYVTRFKFFKIIGVKVIIQPRLTYELEPLVPARIMIDWTNQVDENILADDGAKQVMYYNTRPKIYRFKSPNVVVTKGGTAYSLGGWMHTGINLNNLPGYLKISSEFPINLTCETVVVFRGNQTDINPQSQIIRFEGGKVIDEKDKKLEDEKEDEVREEKVDKLRKIIEEGKDEEIDEEKVDKLRKMIRKLK